MRKEDLEKLRQEFPIGIVLELIEDMQSDGKLEKSMSKGLQGKVDYIDDAGQLHMMKWNKNKVL